MSDTQWAKSVDDRYLSYLKQMPGFVAVLTGPDHRFDYVNDAYVTIAGDRQFLGRTVRDVFPELAGQGFYELLDEVYTSGAPFSAKGAPIQLAGEQRNRFIDFLYQPIRDNDGAVTGIFVGGYDTTDRFREQAHRDALVRLTDRIKDFSRIYDIAFAAAEILGEVLNVSRVGYGTIDSEAETLHVQRDWNAPGVETLEGAVHLRHYGLFIDYLKKGELISIADVESDSRTAAAADALKARGAGSLVNVPVLERDRLVAVLYVNNETARQWTTGELTLIQEVASRTRVAAERSRNVTALRDSESRFRALVNASSDVVYRMSPDWTEMRQLDGRGFLPDTDVPSVRWIDKYILPEDRPRVEEAARRAVEAKAVFELEHRVRRSDGAIGWTFSRAVPVLGDDGEIVEWFGMASDVTARKQTQDRTATLIDLSNAIRDMQDPDDLAYTAAETLGRTLGVSRAGYGTIDRRNETITIKRDWNAEGVRSLAGRLQFRDYGSYIDDLKRGETVVLADAEVDPRTAANAEALKAISAQSFVNMPVTEQGDFVALLYLNNAVRRDWSSAELSLIREVAERTRTAVERLRAEAELTKSGARLREMNETLEAQVAARTAELRQFQNIVEATTSPICAFDRDFRLIAFNKAHNDEFRRVNGFDTKLGDVFPDLFIPEQQPIMRALMARALSGEQFTVTQEFGRPELGQPAWEISYTPLRDEDGQVIGAFHLATDISERLRSEAELTAAQEALRQSQKMEAMGSLTGGVAHDFNNLLTPIVGALDMLQRKRLGGEREQRLIAGAIQSADRAKTLVQRLLAFARRQPLQPTAVDLAPLVRGMAELIASTTGPQIKVIVDAADGLPLAKADPNQLEMAILNLSVNARDAMPNGGTLRISVDAVTAEDTHRAEVRPGKYLLLSVDDTGEGMDETTARRAIEPFFSTKGVGKGTGLGLSMVHGLASQLGGTLTITSRLGHGTRIELWLPQSTNRSASIETAAETKPLATGSGTVLLVDDEELVRLSTADMLNELGYFVVEAESAEHALRLIEKGLQPNLLVTDHLMPGMSGTELARRLRADNPEIKVLVVSGYAEAHGIDPALPRLTKPFRNADLAAVLATNS